MFNVIGLVRCWLARGAQPATPPSEGISRIRIREDVPMEGMRHKAGARKHTA